ncbi:MAG: hypothetical protein RR471_12370, partial [Bacteroides sp.]
FHMENMASTAPKTTINASASATAVAVVDVSQTMSLMWSLPDSALSAERKAELAKLLTDLEDSKKKGASKVKEAAKVVGDWLFSKGIEAIPAVMPFVSQAIQDVL